MKKEKPSCFICAQRRCLVRFEGPPVLHACDKHIAEVKSALAASLEPYEDIERPEQPSWRPYLVHYDTMRQAIFHAIREIEEFQPKDEAEARAFIKKLQDIAKDKRPYEMVKAIRLRALENYFRLSEELKTEASPEDAA